LRPTPRDAKSEPPSHYRCHGELKYKTKYRVRNRAAQDDQLRLPSEPCHNAEVLVNRLRYLEGTPKGSTRWNETGWALGDVGVLGEGT
jgi:hypothetical protein